MEIKKFFFNKITLNLALWAILMLIIVAGSNMLLKVITKHNQEITVPDLTNMSVEEASDILSERHMRLDVVDSVFVKRMGKGLIYRQNPAAGSKVKEGRRILLTINAVNAKKVSMPNLIGYSMRQAKAEILSRGLQVGRLIYVSDIATNNVLRQVCSNTEIRPGTQIESGSKIDLVLGLNNEDNTTYIPYIIGLKYMNATEAIIDNSLNIKEIHFDKTVKDYSDSLNAVVYRQTPEASEEQPIPMGSEISLYMTTDTRKIPVKPEEESAE